MSDKSLDRLPRPTALIAVAEMRPLAVVVDEPGTRSGGAGAASASWGRDRGWQAPDPSAARVLSNSDSRAHQYLEPWQ